MRTPREAAANDGASDADTTGADPQAMHETALFLREWLPAEALRKYRQLILKDPEEWHRHPHFSGGLVVKHLLQGNGITARALGVRDLDEIWPDLVKLAVTVPAETAEVEAAPGTDGPPTSID